MYIRMYVFIIPSSPPPPAPAPQPPLTPSCQTKWNLKKKKKFSKAVKSYDTTNSRQSKQPIYTGCTTAWKGWKRPDPEALGIGSRFPLSLSLPPLVTQKKKADEGTLTILYPQYVLVQYQSLCLACAPSTYPIQFILPLIYKPNVLDKTLFPHPCTYIPTYFLPKTPWANDTLYLRVPPRPRPNNEQIKWGKQAH